MILGQAGIRLRVSSLALYRPGRTASRISCPHLAVISTRDQSVLAAPALKAARRAPAGEVLEVDGEHYAAVLDQHETVVAAELDFLRRHLLRMAPGEGPQPIPIAKTCRAVTPAVGGDGETSGRITASIVLPACSGTLTSYTTTGCWSLPLPGVFL